MSEANTTRLQTLFFQAEQTATTYSTVLYCISFAEKNIDCKRNMMVSGSVAIAINNSLDGDDEIHHESHADQTESTSAQIVVHLAANRIGLPPSKLEHLLHTMNAELISEAWQLQFLDSTNYRDMGFPIGLVSSIRRIIHELEMENMANEGYESNDNDVDTPMSSMDLTAQNLGVTEEDAAEQPGMKRISDITISQRLSDSFMLTGMKWSAHPHLSSGKGQNVGKGQNKDLPPVSAPRRTLDSSSNRVRISDITLSKRLSNSLMQAGVMAQSNKDLPPVSARRHSSIHNRSIRSPNHEHSQSMPPRPLRRPTVVDAQTMKMVDFDDFSAAESLSMDSVGMLFVSKHDGTGADPNGSMAVVTGSLKDLRKYLVEGVDCTIDEVAENESKLSDGEPDQQM